MLDPPLTPDRRRAAATGVMTDIPLPGDAVPAGGDPIVGARPVRWRRVRHATVDVAGRSTPPDPPAASATMGRTTTSAHHDPEHLYRSTAPAVLGYLRAQGVTDPEDVLMDVFVTVVRDLERVTGDAQAVRRWVFSIAHHRVVDQRRWNARRTRLDPVELDRLVGTVEGAERFGADPALVAALARLTADQRAVLGLRLVADLPVHDVAEILGKRPDAVTALQRRATARLAGLLAPGAD